VLNLSPARRVSGIRTSLALTDTPSRDETLYTTESLIMSQMTRRSKSLGFFHRTIDVYHFPITKLLFPARPNVHSHIRL
jgi:hypothetical protein